MKLGAIKDGEFRRLTVLFRDVVSHLGNRAAGGAIYRRAPCLKYFSFIKLVLGLLPFPITRQSNSQNWQLLFSLDDDHVIFEQPRTSVSTKSMADDAPSLTRSPSLLQLSTELTNRDYFYWTSTHVLRYVLSSSRFSIGNYSEWKICLLVS